MKKILFLLIISPVFYLSQNCNCEKNFLWLKNTFEENDAGFQYVIDKKGESAYKIFSQEKLNASKKITNYNECRDLMDSWMRFFRKSHYSISVIAKPTDKAAHISDNSQKYETLNIDINQFKEDAKNLKNPNYEGVWSTPPYTIGIQKTGEEYIGFIIDAPNTGWDKNQIKLKFKSVNENEITGSFYLKDHSPEVIKSIKLTGKNLLSLGRFSLRRILPVLEESQSMKDYVQAMGASEPYFKKISEKTTYLRIPNFSSSQKKKIDSVLKVNHQMITQTQNFIIDVRNNGGGSDESYSNIIPYLYTNPIRVVGLEFLSTKLNNQRMLNFLNSNEVEEKDKKWLKEAYDKLENNLGKFVSLKNEKITITKEDKIFPYPQNVAIIINSGNGSTTEQFLLAAKQSKKVKLFGTTTFGVLDISNMNFVESPDHEFYLGYCLSKSYRIPDMTIDDKGIMPDYYLDSTIPGEQWVEFTENILNSK